MGRGGTVLGGGVSGGGERGERKRGGKRGKGVGRGERGGRAAIAQCSRYAHDSNSRKELRSSALLVACLLFQC